MPFEAVVWREGVNEIGNYEYNSLAEGLGEETVSVVST